MAPKKKAAAQTPEQIAAIRAAAMAKYGTQSSAPPAAKPKSGASAAKPAEEKAAAEKAPEAEKAPGVGLDGVIDDDVLRGRKVAVSASSTTATTLPSGTDWVKLFTREGTPSSNSGPRAPRSADALHCLSPAAPQAR